MGFPADCTEHRSLKGDRDFPACQFLLTYFFLPLSGYRSQKGRTPPRASPVQNARGEFEGATEFEGVRGGH